MNNKTMMQYFEWYLPSNQLLWRRVAAQAKELAANVINMIWLPPAYKGAAGAESVGYDVYDTYDLGEFDQKDTIATKYGTKEEYIDAVRTLQANGIEVLADIVLNHMMGADERQRIRVQEDDSGNRTKTISKGMKISAWTRFTFPGRRGKYSGYTWNASNFSGTDWDDERKRSGIFRMRGKLWESLTDDENGNFDYLMGMNLDMENPETVRAVTNWAKWYVDTVQMDGFRLDAVKHIKFTFYRDWLKELKAHMGRDCFAVGEYWSGDLGKLMYYLEKVEYQTALFDVPLHFHMLSAATSNGGYDMSKLMKDTLVSKCPEYAVTFVDNHDTQPGQALYSFIPTWFKQHAYALILLQEKGIPCVFYGDYYGIPHDRISPVAGLRVLCKVRKDYAYGEQINYFDDFSTVGFVRCGDKEHENSGLIVLMTDSIGGGRKLFVSKRFAGIPFYDILHPYNPPVVLDDDGYGMFYVDGGAVGVWIKEQVYEKLSIEYY